MLLHLVSDSVFTDIVIELFEIAAPDRNIYLFADKYQGYEIKHIKNISRITLASSMTREFWPLFDKNKISAVIIHGMSRQACRAINKFSGKIHFHWMCWGYDLYEMYDQLDASIFQPETKEAFRKSRSPERHILKAGKKVLRELYFRATGNTLKADIRKSIRSSLKKVRSCSMVIEEDFDLFKTVTGSKAKHLLFNYGYLEDLVPMNMAPRNNGRHILLGNSGTWTNNHLEALQVLKLLPLNEDKVKVYTPLCSWDEEYREMIIRRGKEILGDCFVPLTDFMTKNEFLDHVGQCAVAIMNHNRQQAMGTILILLWLGLRLYLNESNPVCRFLERMGINFSILNNGMSLSSSQDLQPLSEAEILANRKALLNYYSRDPVIERTRHLCDYLLNRSSA